MFSPKPHYENNSDDPNKRDPFARVKMATCKWTGELLERHYPGHTWWVEVDGDRFGAVIKIQIRVLMPADRWYVVNFRDAVSDPGGRRIINGAGELLERYGIPRTGFTVDNWKAALARFPIGNGRGHLEPLR